MPAKIKPLTIYLDEDAPPQLERLRAYYTEKNGGVPMSDSGIGRSLIREKDADIVNKATRSLTLQRIYEEVEANHEVVKRSLASILALLEDNIHVPRQPERPE